MCISRQLINMRLPFAGTLIAAIAIGVFSSPTPRISFGHTAIKGAWPSQVLIITGDDPGRICGGTIISSQWVLTVAHCVRDNENGVPHNPLSYKLKFGVYDRFHPDGSEVTRNIIEIIRHPHYETQNHSHDMALLKMDEPLDFSKHKHLRPICLDLYGKFDGHSDCYMTGFGRTSNEHKDDNNVPSKLQQLEMRPFDHEKCRQIHHKFYENEHSKEEVTDLQICMVSKVPETPSKGAGCAGDSGGPLQCKVGHNWYQVGVIWSVTDCETGPTVFQWLPKYKDFIREHTNYGLPAYCIR